MKVALGVSGGIACYKAAEIVEAEDKTRQAQVKGLARHLQKYLNEAYQQESKATHTDHYRWAG